MKIGIVGLPNVGKSTLFNALVKNAAAVASNYPFCTIDPNVGVVEVPDERLGVLSSLVHPEKVIPAVVEFYDIAGIIKGAASGEGLGNKFLSHIRDTAAIILVARFFEDPDVIHVHGKTDPAHDLQTVLLELILADLETAERCRDRYAKAARGNDRDAKTMHDFTVRVIETLSNERPASTIKPESEPEQIALREMQLLTAKPILVVANIGENDLNLTSEELYGRYDLSAIIPSSEWLLPICAKLESELINLPDNEREEFLAGYGLKESGLNRLIRSAYHLLGLQTYFTAGVKEVRAWTIPQGARAPQAAGVIHTDFEKGFIRAEVIAYADYAAYQGEQGAKEAGRLRSEGKEYFMQDGDVVHFRFNV